MVVSGESLEGMHVQEPLTGNDIPVLIDNDVDILSGTGANLIAPGHDFRSLGLAYHYGLSKEGVLDSHGKVESG